MDYRLSKKVKKKSFKTESIFSGRCPGLAAEGDPDVVGEPDHGHAGVTRSGD